MKVETPPAVAGARVSRAMATVDRTKMLRVEGSGIRQAPKGGFRQKQRVSVMYSMRLPARVIGAEALRWGHGERGLA